MYARVSHQLVDISYSCNYISKGWSGGSLSEYFLVDLLNLFKNTFDRNVFPPTLTTLNPNPKAQ